MIDKVRGNKKMRLGEIDKANRKRKEWEGGRKEVSR